jgi:hypothetical protein
MNITVKRNNDLAYDITVKEDGAAVDITDWTIYFTVKASKNDPDGDAIIQKTITSHTTPLSGLSALSILAADTADKEPGDYYYDFLFVDDSDMRQSSETGTFTIEQEIGDGA